jgi:hypothetical protein
VTSLNEPGSPKKGDSLNEDSSIERAYRATPAQAGGMPDAGDSPPWQRGAARTARSTHREPPEPHAETRSPAPPSGADARLRRFTSGTAAPGASPPAHAKTAPRDTDAVATRSDSPPAEAYASELPDLSGPIPRATQRKPAPDHSDGGAGSATGRSSTADRESREAHVQVSRRTRGPVRASMQIRRIDPWSTLKVSLLLSVALFFVWMIAVAFLYLVLGGMGVWSKLNSNVGDLLNNTSGSSGELVSSGTIFGGAVLIGLVNIVLMTALATIAAFVYNLATDLIGGIEVTLADQD